MLADHVEKLEPPPIGGGIELEVHGLHLVWILSSVTPHRVVCWPGQLALPGHGPLQALLQQHPLQPLVIHAPAFSPE